MLECVADITASMPWDLNDVDAVEEEEEEEGEESRPRATLAAAAASMDAFFAPNLWELGRRIHWAWLYAVYKA